MPSKGRAASRLRSVPLENQSLPKPKSNDRKRAASVLTDEEDKTVAPRKRGRPPKNVPDRGKEPLKEAVSQKLGDEGDKTVPRKRGRPPKIARTTAGGEPVKERPAQDLARGSRTKAINTLQQPAPHPRPPRLCFVFGTGDFGQFGLGTETLGEISRPRLHAWFETASKGDTLGSEGAGVEKICAGGMHTLAVDEAGKVETTMTLCCDGLLIWFVKVWSWGINDNASLGRPTTDVPDPDNPSETLEAELLETQPIVLQSLVDEKFRAVDVSAGDSVSVALGHEGDLRSWGSFRVSPHVLVSLMS